MDYVAAIRELARELPVVKIMEVCGGHTNTIVRYGIREVLPDNVKLISGPGCPVCVTSQRDIDSAIALALSGVKLATYGDMFNTPGSLMSLRDARARGADVKMIYSVDEIIDEKDRVFFAVGFETTIPMTAKALEAGLVVFSAHKLIPPAMRLLVQEMDIAGFIDPGHVSTIIGSDIWASLDLGVPQVIAGFSPKQLIKAIHDLLVLIKNKQVVVKNNYSEVVRPEGNVKARNLINEFFKVVDAEWRGMGVIPSSGLVPVNPDQDARIIYKDIIDKVESFENPACRCGEVVRGLVEPKDCPLFGKSCTPSNPQGACMVSDSEGACAIAFKYGRSLSE